ncbi:MAG: TonB-dependent receptor plug domain-containing protein [Saprospiraceae bacterium]|nr:TonB-dependent receptor plug domain-containing protein [Saprospiraceae bacterium]
MKKVLVLLFVLKISAFAQSKVEGIVLDKETKLPLIGASILVPNTSTGALTDYDGKFEIILPQGTDRIEVSYIGYMTKVINDFSVKSGLEILLESSNVIDEVVVVGYTTQLKKDLTGSVSVVNINEVGKVPYANALQALQGRVSGVNFTQDGQPGSGRTQVRVRGFTSFNNSDPLLVVDGIPTQEPLDNINPNDIESIQILKDASASIYGSRSAAGVIIVTTKKGKKGKLSIDAGTSIGYNTIANKIDLLNAQQWGDVYWKASKILTQTKSLNLHPILT